MVHLWFWAWLVIAAVCALYELFAGEMLSLPWALGALAAALLELLGAVIAWQWVAFFGVSFVTTIVLRRWYLARQRASLAEQQPDTPSDPNATDEGPEASGA